MAFSDPLSITIGGTTTPLAKVFSEGSRSTYRSADGKIQVSASHFYNKKRYRDEIRLVTTVRVPDPLNPSINIEGSDSVIIAFDRDKTIATDNATLTARYVGLTAALSASSNALLLKLLGGES